MFWDLGHSWQLQAYFVFSASEVQNLHKTFLNNTWC